MDPEWVEVNRKCPVDPGALTSPLRGSWVYIVPPMKNRGKNTQAKCFGLVLLITYTELNTLISTVISSVSSILD